MIWIADSHEYDFQCSVGYSYMKKYECLVPVELQSVWIHLILAIPNFVSGFYWYILIIVEYFLKSFYFYFLKSKGYQCVYFHKELYCFGWYIWKSSDLVYQQPKQSKEYGWELRIEVLELENLFVT